MAVLTGGAVDLGSAPPTIVKGDIFVITGAAATVGRMMDVADLATNDFVTIVGYATSPTAMAVDLTVTGQLIP